MFYGYARVSTTDQDLSIQLDALVAAGCTAIRSEKITGSSTGGRNELAALLQFLRKGDTLVVTRVDRLTRSLRDLQNIVYDLRQRGVTLKAAEQPMELAPRPVSASWTCWASLLNSKPIYVASDRWRASRGRRSTGPMPAKAGPPR
jgi:hypothetical protein